MREWKRKAKTREEMKEKKGIERRSRGWESGSGDEKVRVAIVFWCVRLPGCGGGVCL